MDIFSWLIRQVFDGLRIFWPVTLVFVLLIVIAGVHTFLLKHVRIRTRHLLVLSPTVLSLMVLVWGTLMKLYDAPGRSGSFSNVLLVLSLLHIPLAIGIVYSMKDLRLFAATVVLFELWIACLCSFVAVMSQMKLF